MHNRHIAIITLASFAMLGTPAAAEPVPATAGGPEIVVVRKLPPRDLLTRTVYIGDLNLKSADDRQVMEKRVAKAVEDMCSIPSPIPGQERGMTKPCRDEAWTNARSQMDGAVQRAVGS
jgi:UrcA family protein